MLRLTAHCTHCGHETVHEREKLFKDRYGLGLTVLFGPAVLPFWLAVAEMRYGCDRDQRHRRA